MTEVDRPLVRPAFRRWSTIALVVLLPFVIHSMWDYIEARRLHARIDAIARAGDPVTVLPFRPIVGAAADADRYYRAAAALATSGTAGASPQQSYRLATALSAGDWTTDLIDAIRPKVDANAEALGLVDRAATLPFAGFTPGWSFNYLAGSLSTLATLCELRAVVRAAAGDADAAMDSLYSEARLGRATRWPPAFSALPFVLARAHPSDASRAKLARALADLDVPDRPHRELAQSRAHAIDDAVRLERPPARWFEVVERPWLTHALNRYLDEFTDGRWEERTGTMRFYTKQSARIHCMRRLAAAEVVNCPP